MKNLKKISAVVLALLIVAVALCSCGVYESSKADSYYNGNNKGGYSDEAEYGFEDVDYEIPRESLDNNGDPAASPKANNDLSGRKIIKTVNMTVQTKEYDEFMKNLNTLINESGGYIESSERYDRDYGSYSRYATFTIRVPAENLSDFTSGVQANGNVTHFTEGVDDVTLSYVDIQARINSLRTELETLTRLLEQADSLEYVIQLQDRITNVRYELESYESRIRTMDALIAYSTVKMTVNEVERETVVEKQGTWEEIGTNLSDNLSDIGEGFRRFFIWFVSALPYLIMIAAIVAIVVVIIVVSVRKSRKRRMNK